MASTLMKDSVVGDDWIKAVCRDNPTGMLPGDGRYISTGPCRLAFCDTLWEPKAPPNQPNGTPKYSVCALYTPFTDMNVFYGEYFRVCAEMFPDFYNPHLNGGAGGYSGLESPFHDAATKAHKFEGFTPGLTYINHTSKFKPAIVTPPPGPGMEPMPVTDKSKLYPGVWAILVVNAYGYGKSPPQPKKGVSFGIQAVMLIGDDKNLAGGGIDAGTAFSGVNVKPPAVAAGAFSGMFPPGAGAPPMMGQPPRPPMPGAPAMAPPPAPNAAALAAYPPAEDDDLSALM